jgi:hypothetical protein
VRRSVERLLDALATRFEDVRPGVLLSRSRSIEADRSAFDSEDARRELFPEAIAMVDDVLLSLQDLLAIYPIVRKIEAERLALSIQRDATLSGPRRAGDQRQARDLCRRLGHQPADLHAEGDDQNYQHITAAVVGAAAIVRIEFPCPTTSSCRWCRDDGGQGGRGQLTPCPRHCPRPRTMVRIRGGNPELTRASQSPCRTTYSSAMMRAGHRRNQYDQPCGVRCGQPRGSLLPSPGQGSRAFVGRTGSVVYNPLNQRSK